MNADRFWVSLILIRSFSLGGWCVVARRGTSGIDVDLRRVDIDQCPQRRTSGGTAAPLNIFAGTDKCKQQTTEVSLLSLHLRIHRYTHTHTHPLPGIGPLRTKAEDGQTRMWITMGIRVYDRMKAPFHQSRHSVSYLPACLTTYLPLPLQQQSRSEGWKRPIWMCPEFV